MKSCKVFIDSAAWMCEGNIIATSRIYRYLLANGHEITTKPSEADFLIINSCGFVKERETLSIDLYKDCASQKKDTARIILFGCLIKINKEKITALDVIPIDFNEGYKFDELFATNIKFDDMEPYCDESTTNELAVGKKTIQESKFISFFLSRLMSHVSRRVRVNYQGIMNRVKFKDKTLIEICSGCIFHCRYCRIRNAKGNIHSRPLASILSDIEKLYNPSHNLFLVADDCGCYGLDIKTDLFHLLNEIHKHHPEARLELDAINPYWLEKYPEKYIKLFQDSHISFATIPMQSGSNQVIKSMNRTYNVRRIQDLIRTIKTVSPSTAIYTHFIVGYPSEKFIDFLQSLRCSMYFDLPIVLEYSAHSATDSYLPRGHSKYTIRFRYILFELFLNVVIFHKLLTFSSASAHTGKEIKVCGT